MVPDGILHDIGEALSPGVLHRKSAVVVTDANAPPAACHKHGHDANVDATRKAAFLCRHGTRLHWKPLPSRQRFAAAQRDIRRQQQGKDVGQKPITAAGANITPVLGPNASKQELLRYNRQLNEVGLQAAERKFATACVIDPLRRGTSSCTRCGRRPRPHAAHPGSRDRARTARTPASRDGS